MDHDALTVAVAAVVAHYRHEPATPPVARFDITWTTEREGWFDGPCVRSLTTLATVLVAA